MFNSLMKYICLLVGLPGCAMCGYFLANKEDDNQVKIVSPASSGDGSRETSAGIFRSINGLKGKIVPEIPKV